LASIDRPENIVTSTSVNFSPRPGGTAKCDAGCSIRRSVRSRSGIFSAWRSADWTASITAAGSVIQPARVAISVLGIGP
jgi:hypothetical protein